MLSLQPLESTYQADVEPAADAIRASTFPPIGRRVEQAPVAG